MIDGVTPVLLITFNEAPNIARTLNKLGWARRIVVDSGSGTLEILARYPQVALSGRDRRLGCRRHGYHARFGLTRVGALRPDNKPAKVARNAHRKVTRQIR